MRGNWQRFQQHYGENRPFVHQQNSHQRLNEQLRPTSASIQVQKDVVAFIEAFRANQSSPSAPPNALTLDIVVRATCNHFHVNAFEELMGFSALQLPALKQLHTVNQRVWTFVTCYLHSRRINTLYECHQAFLQHEGLQSFHELKLGNSFLHTEAVQQLYHSPSVMFTITTGDVVTCLRQFENLLGQDVFRASSHVDLHEFLHYLAQHYRQPSSQTMGVFIDPYGFGAYVGLLRRVANHEMKELKTVEQQFQREVAEKMFRLTKEKFSDENRKQALNELLQRVNSRTETERSIIQTNGNMKSSLQSLSLDLLQRVTDVDVYLDNVLRRKAAANAKTPQQYSKPISSQAIAETDSKLRNQLTRFLVSSQKSRHHSRLKVVTWVICSIIAKTCALLSSDDKLPADDEESLKKVMDESDKEECNCCCVNESLCTCSCTCKCHVESSDEEDEVESDNVTKGEKGVTVSSEVFPVSPADPFATRHAKLNQSAIVTLEDVKAEITSFLNANMPKDQPQTTKDVLLVLSSLEENLINKFTSKSKDVSWAGRRSVLELLPEIMDNGLNDDIGAAKCLSNLFMSIQVNNDRAATINTTNKKLKEGLLPFIRDCRATIASSSSLSTLSSEEQQQWIARRLSVELGGAHILDSLFPSAEEILKLMNEDTSSDDSSIVKYSGSLDLRYDDNSSCKNSTGELIEQALVELRNCPFLVNVALYLNWQERYASPCGPLLSFIRLHEMMLLDHAPSNNFLLVCCINGAIVRVNESSTPSDLELLLRRAEQKNKYVTASQVALHLVSMVVTSKGQANFPQQLVQAHLRAYLINLEENDLKRFLVEVLMETPNDFADFILSLLLGAVGHDAGSEFVDQVWKACKTDAECKTLMLISKRSSSPLWTYEANKWCTSSANMADTSSANMADTSNASETCVTSFHCGKEPFEKKFDPSFDAANISVDGKSKVASLINTEEISFSPKTAAKEVDDESWNDAHITSCQSFVEDIRKKQFGVGLQIQDEATTSVLLIQQQRLERALKRLSDELYSESTHFVLELLQNADDNKYDEGVTPRGEFTLTADKKIVFYNNEQGFSSANIQAICDVGASTKAAENEEASIGKKGIGFKSVFKVSDHPQVHSNGFHICFHAKSSMHGNGMGYILPYWLDDTTQWQQIRGTTFVLPLNETSVQRMDDISQSLLAFEPSVLLFLRRIQELRVRVLAQDYSLHFLKKEKTLSSNSRLVQLYCQEKKSENIAKVTQQNWLVIKEMLELPQIFHRKHFTEIAVAIPIALKEDSNKLEDRPPLQQVFCYLPLRSYGFRFILQGDFEIPSSREAITNGSEWNEWLVSKFPELVRDAVFSYVSMLQTSELIAGISHMLSLLPLENEVQAPFRSIVQEIMRLLRQVKWLPSATPSSSTIFEMPAELIDCFHLMGNDASEIKNGLLEMLSEDVLVSTCCKRLLHPDVSSAMSGSMKSQLRIEQLNASHMLRILSLSAQKNDIDWTVDVLTVLAKLWRKDRLSGLLRQELRLIKCFPLQHKERTDGNFKWVSLADAHDSLFLSSFQADDKVSTRKQFYAFFNDLRILDDHFTKAVSKNSKLRAFLLNDVGLHVMEDHDMIRHHILPTMAVLCNSTECTDKKEVEARGVLEFGQFLASHLMGCRNCSMHENVKLHMVVATTCGRLIPAGSLNLFAILPSTSRDMAKLVEWIKLKVKTCDEAEDAISIVSDSYYFDSDTETPFKDLDEQWQYLLTKICDVPMLLDIVNLKSDARLQTGTKQLLKWIEAEEDNDVKRSMSMLLAQHMEKQWEHRKYGDSESDSESLENDDTGLSFWQHYRWVEGSDAHFHRPNELWLTTDEVTRLFTPSMVTFSSMVWKSDEFAKQVLGMKSTATVSDVLSVISTLAVNPTAMSLLNLDQMIQMYSYLWEKSQRSDETKREILSAFTEKAMIFSPAKMSTESNESQFVGTNYVVWTSSLQERELVVLETLYPKFLRDFFTKICGVQRKPSVSFLCKMLSEQKSNMCGKNLCDVKVWKKKMLPLLCALSKKVEKNSLSTREMKEIQKTLKSIPWLPVRSISESSSEFVYCSSKDEPVQAITKTERKLLKLVIFLTKEKSADNMKKRKNEEIKLIQPDCFEEDTDLNAILRLAKVSTLSLHLKSHGSTWCKIFAHLASTQQGQKKSKKKLKKLGQLLVKAWANIFSSSDEQEKADFLVTVQHLKLFPVIDKRLQWTSAASMYINDQTELSKEDLLKAGQAEQLQVLGLFPWNYFLDGLAIEEISNDANVVRTFLVECCGMKSLKAHLQYEVSVLSTQHPASDAFHKKIHTAFALAQRCLYHWHRTLYDKLPHNSFAKLALRFQCILVDGHDGFQVVYRVGNSFSLRRGVDSLSRCFFDVPNNVLYLQSITGEEEASALSMVLVELSQRLFGAHVATNVANFLYLSLLQPNAGVRENWLIKTQRLPPLPSSEADKLWVQQVSDSLSSDECASYKRTFNDMEDGELSATTVFSNKLHHHIEVNDREFKSPYQPLTSFTNGFEQVYDRQTPRSLCLSNSGNAEPTGAAYHLPLPVSPTNTGLQSLSLSNTMTKEEREAIGRWGEEYVYNQLKRQYAESNTTVEWLNEKEESGLPYDLTLSSKSKVEEYIEVKSTRTMEKGVFEISMNELDQAAIYGSSYCIYRVFNAGNSALCRVIRLKNPVSLVRQRKIQLALVMQ
ncbi:phosphoserine aminotransferase [Plasmopara halstedii]|uniref:Phosphoserine aminotransferase n=1 Tax=Plasmopara halstedii TaxID=4781 RepID=A0A0P1AB16_PLAHL|nr:phosphoserine aminotransferase [Plasmopara halstedii]CEG37945.1 phosphoserine aminotransferase [Plasmopara halstedii]|eukprot:XP_024574314.1 phosphoserine aminotransferase [Plasmopara halstedii]